MKKAVLIILDGWGYGNHSKSDAIHNAKTPFVDQCLKDYPHSELITSGEQVGLPAGQMGNSEVGHLNLGAGRIVYQDLLKINKGIEDGSFKTNKVLLEAFHHAKKENKSLHFMGLASDGGIHSHINHLYALCDMAKEQNLENVFIHAFTDGRDCDPTTGRGHITRLLNYLEDSPCELASMIGRYYAMDRDKRWERIRLAYDMLLKGKGKKSTDFLKALEESYNEEITDEFLKPVVKQDENGMAKGRIKSGDVVICFNFRTDRCRQITEVLTQKDRPEHQMQTIPLHYVTMTNYDKSFKGVNVVFDKENIKNTIGEVLEKNNRTQIRIAETEKYPHVSYFFSGGRETPFEGEKRIMINSPKVATYDLKPEMSAYEVTDSIVTELKKGDTDFVCLNFANPDMVGHTGNYNAIVKAVEVTDGCTKKVVEAGLENEYSFIIIADHGNADLTINEDGSINTAHTTNPVPCILIDKDYNSIKDGKLGDIAPTLLTLMGIEIPIEMTGNVLINNSGN